MDSVDQSPSKAVALDKLRSILSIVVGTLATLLSGLYAANEAVIDASFDKYGFPLPWLVHSEGFGFVTPVNWIFNWLFFALDVLLYAALAYAVFFILAKAKLFQKTNLLFMNETASIS
jgi:hypothetical protein